MPVRPDSARSSRPVSPASWGTRIDPATDGRPDSRPDVRENIKQLGDLIKDFDFTQKPLPPLILNPCPPDTTLVPKPEPGCNGKAPLHANTWGDT